MVNNLNNKIEQLAFWLEEVEAVLIGAGAGLSAEAGFDYTDEDAFARSYPGLLQYGFRKKVDLMGFGHLPEELQWGYYLANVKEVRFCEPPQPIYEKLFEIVREKRDYFVITTNVDALFEKNGFDKKRIFTPQGDYAFMQCAKPCTKSIWDVRSDLERFLPLIDSATQKLPAGQVPRCPNCGGHVFLNVRGGNWFVEEPYMEGASRLGAWLKKNNGRKMLVIDIGSGFNTPVWIRWPCENIVRASRRSRLARINLHHPEVPADIAARSLTFAAKAGEVIFALGESKLN